MEIVPKPEGAGMTINELGELGGHGGEVERAMCADWRFEIL